MVRLRELFIKRLSEALEARGAKSELHRKTGYGRQTIDRWLAGERVPDLDQLEQVASALDADPLDLLAPEIAANSNASTRASSVQLADIAAGDEGTTPNTPQPAKDALLGQIVQALAALDETQLKHLLTIVKTLPLAKAGASFQSSKERKQ